MARSSYREFWALAAPVPEAGGEWNVPSEANFVFFVRNDSEPIRDAQGGIVSPAPIIELSINRPFAEATDRIIVLRPGDTLNEVPVVVNKLFYRSKTSVEGYIRALLFQE